MAVRRFLWPKTLAGKAGVVATSCVLLLVGAYAAARHHTSKRLQAAWRLTEQFGLSNDLQDLLGPYVPLDESAATPLDQASALACDFLAGVRQKHNFSLADNGTDNSVLQAAMDALISNTQYERLLCETDRRQNYFTCLTFASPLVTTSLGRVRDRHYVLDAERLIALRLAALDRREEAVARLLRLHRLTRRWQDKEPFLILADINLMIRRITLDTLNVVLRSGGPLSPETHDAIDAEVSTNESVLAILPRIGLTEVLLVTDALEHDSIASYPLGGLLTDYRKARTIENAHRMIVMWDRPYLDARDEKHSLNEERSQSPTDPIALRLNWGTYEVSNSVFFKHARFTRVIAKSRCLRVVNAWCRKGDSMAELASLRLPAECLVDPFDGQRLRIKRTPDGPIVYSVDKNLKDDGGTWGRPTADNFEPWEPDDVTLGPVTKSVTK